MAPDVAYNFSNVIATSLKMLTSIYAVSILMYNTVNKLFPGFNNPPVRPVLRLNVYCHFLLRVL